MADNRGGRETRDAVLRLLVVVPGNVRLIHGDFSFRDWNISFNVRPSRFVGSFFLYGVVILIKLELEL